MVDSNSDRLRSGAAKKKLFKTAGIAVAVGSTAFVAVYAASIVTTGVTTSSGTTSLVTIPVSTNVSANSSSTTATANLTAGVTVNKTYHTLSEYLWNKPSSDGDDDQGKFLQAVATEMRKNGVATYPTALKAPRLGVSEDRRSLQTADGKPFYWMSDTAWMWLYRMYMNERRDYLDARAAQGFNVLLFQMLTGGYGQKDLAQAAIFDAKGVKYGPALTRKPNIAFWGRARRAVEDISRAGVVPAMVLTWGAHVRQGLFDKQAAYDYGRLIGRAFGDLNMIFILGGDINPTASEKLIWDAMAQGIRAGEPQKNLITFHAASGSASDYFGDRDWLDIDAIQSGHARFRPRTKAIGEFVYQRYIKTGTQRPLVDVESGYERIVDNLYTTEPDVTKSVSEDKRLDAYDIRVRAYQQWASGAMGYGYGEIDTIMSWKQGIAPRWPVNQNWRDALRVEGGGQLGYFQKLRREVGQASLVPVPEWSELGSTIQDYYRTLTGCNQDRSICIAYDTDGVLVHFPFEPGTFKNCEWMDPRTGQRLACTALKPARGTGTDYTPPVMLNTPAMIDGQWFRNKNDWVLILKK